MLSLLLLLALQDEVKLTAGEVLPGAQRMPAVVAPDGKSVLYFKKTGASYTYALAEGGTVRDLYASPVDWDDVLNGAAAPCTFSPDGKRFVALGTKGGKSFRQEKDPLRCVVVDLEGKAVTIDAEFDVMSASFAGDRVVFIDASMPKGDKAEGYKLKAWDGKSASVLHESGEFGAILRVSPDGARAAFIVLDSKDGHMLVRIVDLKSGVVVDSEGFKSDDVTFDGPPLIYWDAEGKGVYVHKTPDAGGKRPFSLLRFDTAAKKMETILDGKNIAVTCVLDKDLLGVLLRDERCGAVLRVSDRKVFGIPGKALVLGGRGRKLVVADKSEARLVEFELPK